MSSDVCVLSKFEQSQEYLYAAILNKFDNLGYWPSCYSVIVLKMSVITEELAMAFPA